MSRGVAQWLGDEYYPRTIVLYIGRQCLMIIMNRHSILSSSLLSLLQLGLRLCALMLLQVVDVTIRLKRCQETVVG